MPHQKKPECKSVVYYVEREFLMLAPVPAKEPPPAIVKVKTKATRERFNDV